MCQVRFVAIAGWFLRRPAQTMNVVTSPYSHLDICCIAAVSFSAVSCRGASVFPLNLSLGSSLNAMLPEGAAQINLETEKPAKSKVSTGGQRRRQNARKLASYTFLRAHHPSDKYDTANPPARYHQPATPFGCSAIAHLPSRGKKSEVSRTTRVFQRAQQQRSSASYRSFGKSILAFSDHCTHTHSYPYPHPSSVHLAFLCEQKT
jgi:hypothetical protein